MSNGMRPLRLSSFITFRVYVHAHVHVYALNWACTIARSCRRACCYHLGLWCVHREILSRMYCVLKYRYSFLYFEVHTSLVHQACKLHGRMCCQCVSMLRHFAPFLPCSFRVGVNECNESPKSDFAASAITLTVFVTWVSYV